MVANERGQSTNEGVVEFVRKPGAQAAIRRCTDGCFFLTSSLRPVVVEPMEQLDDEDGFSERAFTKKTQEFSKEREVIRFNICLYVRYIIFFTDKRSPGQDLLNRTAFNLLTVSVGSSCWSYTSKRWMLSSVN